MRPRIDGWIDLQAIGGELHHAGLELDQKRAAVGENRRVLVDEFVAQPAAKVRLVVVGSWQMDADLAEALVRSGSPRGRSRRSATRRACRPSPNNKASFWGK